VRGVSLEHLVDKRLGVDSGGEPGRSAQDRALRERMRLAILDEANVVRGRADGGG
jgi:ABC-type Mn2+/Zn2+ transport system ATPase subunit